MNISELARRLNVSPQELRNKLTKLGFDIGQKAIKIDQRTANRIISNWKQLSAKLRRMESLEAEYTKGADQEVKKEKGEVKISDPIVVKEFARRLQMPVTEVLSVLFKNGIMSSMNEKIDYETAAIIAEDLGYIPVAEDVTDEEMSKQEKIKDLLKKDQTKQKPRPPVVVVMGHVDHGKTKLLDAIRKTNVVEQEAGGITQHIGAYQITKNKKKITFIDTPGHEAFTAMRSRGARVADIAILVVAADDGVKPQTIEAIKIIQQAKLPMVVAINKIDKEEANIEKTKQELATHNLVSEDWGGRTIMVPIAAKPGTNIAELIDVLLLVADMEKDNITANPDTRAVGTIIEAHVDKGEGPVATLIVQKGTLKKNDILAVDDAFIGKVRNLKDYNNKEIDKATPSTPAKILGLKFTAEVGDILEVKESVKGLKKTRVYKPAELRSVKPVLTEEEKQEQKKIQKLNVILKGDVLGSVEAIAESLELIENPKIKVEILSKALGNISESDVMRAEAEDALILGFNVSASPQVEDLASEQNVEIKFYSIIYDLIDDIRMKLEEMLGKELVSVEIGKLRVLKIFKTEKKSQIIGAKVITGRVEPNTKLEVYQNDKLITSGQVTELQAGKEVVTDCVEGQECGITFEGDPIVEEGDELRVYKEEMIDTKL